MKKFMAVLKKIGKILLIVLSIGFASFIFFKIRKAVPGKVKYGKGVNFKAVPDDSDKIKLIKKDGSTEVIQLPDKVKFKDVRAAGIVEENKVVVEVLHEKTDRKYSGNAVDNNALDVIGSGLHPDDGG